MKKIYRQANKTNVQHIKDYKRIESPQKDADSNSHFQNQQLQIKQEVSYEAINQKKEQQQAIDSKPTSNSVPIFSLSTSTSSFKATLSNNPDAYFALGTLFGKFYEKEGDIKIENVMFVGNFKGWIEYEQGEKNKDVSVNEKKLYFEGKITQLIIFPDKNNIKHVYKPISDLGLSETSFSGFFKGHFYKWEDVKKNIKDLTLQKKNLHDIAKKIQLNEIYSKSYQSHTQIVLQKIENKQKEEEKERRKKKSSQEYFLPSVLRFEVQNVQEINLQKSMAVVSGFLHLQFKYNDFIMKSMLNTLKLKRQNKKQNESYLDLVIQFNRDYSLKLPLQQLLKRIENNQIEGQDDDDSYHSQSSEWSIQDKTWDIESEIDEKQKIIKFQIWKRFNTEIDNSYGSLFAPLSLNVLRIVVTVNSFTLIGYKGLEGQKGQKCKIHLVACDLLEYTFTDDSKNVRINMADQYNPFIPLNDLKDQFKNTRLHKINRVKCTDNGVFIIADNRMTIYPHYKNALINKNTFNLNRDWRYGIFDKETLLQPPKVQKISDQFEQYVKSSQQQKYIPFSFQKWNYFIIEIPIYKYVVIEMIQIFVPLILLSIISLLIFKQSNGISDSSGFSTLSLRIVNVCSLMIAYVSLIPTLRQNLPPMPNVTLIESIAYFLTLPNLLALVNSMYYYEVQMTEWQQTYKIFNDTIFLISFIITCLSFISLVTMFLVYASRQYASKQYPSKQYNSRQKNRKAVKKQAQYCSPHYVGFMKKIKDCRPGFKVQACKPARKELNKSVSLAQINQLVQKEQVFK